MVEDVDEVGVGLELDSDLILLLALEASSALD